MSAKFEFDRDNCTSCKICVNACFIDVLRWDEEEAKPIAPYAEDCVCCFSCELACPVQAVNVIPQAELSHPPMVS